VKSQRLVQANKKANPSPQVPIHLWAEKYIIPIGKGVRMYIRNESGDTITGVRLNFNGYYFDMPDLTPYMLLAVEHPPEVIEYIAKTLGFADTPFRWWVTGTVAGVAKESNQILTQITTEAYYAKIRFINKATDVPYYPAKAVLLNKLTAEWWEYEGDPDGVINIPKLPYAEWGLYTLVLHYEEADRGLFARAIIDNYDFADYTVKADLVSRVIWEVEVKPKDPTGFSKVVASLLPAPLADAVAWVGNKFGWVSAEIMNLLTVSINGFLLRQGTSAYLSGVRWDAGKEAYIFTFTEKYGPIPILGAIVTVLKWILAITAFATIGFVLIKYADVIIEKTKTERMESLAESIRIIEESDLPPETKKKAIEALTSYATTAEAGTPLHTWVDAFLKLAPIIAIGAIGFGVLMVIRELVRSERGKEGHSRRALNEK